MKSCMIFLVLIGLTFPVAAVEWKSLENQMKTGTGELTTSGKKFRAGGAHLQPLKNALEPGKALVATVRVYVPKEPTKDWASAALALFGSAGHQDRLYAMLIVGDPHLPKNQAVLSVWRGEHQLTTQPIPLQRDTWYSLKAEFNGKSLRMKAWADGIPETPLWQTQAGVQDFKPTGVGIRTYAEAFDFERFETGVRECPEIIVNTEAFRLTLDENGIVQSLSLRRGDSWESVVMRHDSYSGPAWIIDGQTVPMVFTDADRKIFSGVSGDSKVSLRYTGEGRRLAIEAVITNEGTKPIGPLQASLRLGLDTSMEKYPEWNDRYFPTLFRCEKTHFWGYLMTPRGRILTIGSPDPIASWHLNYKQLEHRIFTATLDLLNPPPLPDRHPKGLDSLQPKETKRWTIFLEPVENLDEVKPALAASLDAPMIDCDLYTVAPGETVNVTVYGGKNRQFRPGNKPGVYSITETNSAGKIAEAKISVRHPWSWYAQQARAEAIAKPQKGSSHTESWYGLFSCFNTRRLFPDAKLDNEAEAKFEEIWPLMFDMKKRTPTSWANRIQNSACAAGLLAAKYRATGDIRDLEFAASLVDFLLTKQSTDGAYRNGHTHYTSVVYIGKSIMEVMAEEKKLAETDPQWQKRYERHYESVRRAMDELAKSLDNIETEGEMTYEDGMISCSYTQLAMFALLQTDPAARQKYRDAALYLANGHRCLSQILIPDSRMNGGSLRFWEAQYDVMAKPNMLNSPHGWSAWRIYGLWYLYQLTGQEAYLRQTMNALGSCVQLIDGDSGVLRWAFISDPQINATLFKPDPEHPGRGRSVPQVIGEHYLPMISGWYRAPKNTFVTGYLAMGGTPGGSCDNDVHEIFKCLDEVALTSSYVVERSDGTFAAWNCTTRLDGDKLVVVPNESCVDGVHVNLQQERKVEARFLEKTPVLETVNGMKWIGRKPQ